VQIRAEMVVVGVQTVHGTVAKGWEEAANCWGLGDQKRVAECAEKFLSL